MRVVRGSYLAVISGCAAGAVGFQLLCLTNKEFADSNVLQLLCVHGVLFLVNIGQFLIGVLPVWLFLFLPLYGRLPLKSPLWHPAICPTVGLFAGVGLELLYIRFLYPLFDSTIFSVSSRRYVDHISVAAIIGCVSCMVASRTVHRFRSE